MFFARRRKIKNSADLSLDEILVDASNLPAYNEQQFEGHIEKAISRQTFYGLVVFCLVVLLIFSGWSVWLMIIKGGYYAGRSRNNSLDLTPIFAERGNIYDRQGRELAWTNGAATSTNLTSSNLNNKPLRAYLPTLGLGHLLGYVSFPNEQEIATGLYHTQEYIGRSGVEKTANTQLQGQRGVRIVEVNAQGKEETDHVVRKPVPGQGVSLSIDSQVQAELYELIKQIANEQNYRGGAGVIMDVKTGELLALTSFPDFDPNVLSAGVDRATIKQYLSGGEKAMLNRAVSGLYVPGSTFKLFVALGALEEKIIDPAKVFQTNGELVIPNPYDKTKPSVFKDWQNNGAVDMRLAIAKSCNVYFYIIGGGFGGQKGLGIANIEKYAKLFGLGQSTGINLAGEEEGTIPSPTWKAENFHGEPWRLGDTYHTSIGQYGAQVTPLQIARAYSAIANGGKLLQPTVLKIKANQAKIQATIPIESANFQIVREGMRLAVQGNTTRSLDLPEVAVAAKSGTAELGINKDRMNSWIAGFWPYDNPRYAFAVVMENGPKGNLIGGSAVMREFLSWLAVTEPEYLANF